MAAIHDTDPSNLLGKNVLITEMRSKFLMEFRGTVTGIIKTSVGANLHPAVFLEMPGHEEGEFFTIEDVTITIE